VAGRSITDIILRRFPVERAQSDIIKLSPTEQRQVAPANYDTYTSMYKSHPIVRAVVDKLAKSCVASGYTFVPRDSKGTPNEPAKATLDLIFAHSRAIELLRKTYVDILIYGDSYWMITPSRLGDPYAFRRIHPSQVSVVIDLDTAEETQYIYRDKQGKEFSSPATEWLHFKLFDPDNDTYGLSPLESLKSTVAQDLYAATFNENFFANSATTGIIFNMRNASQQEVERNREFLKKNYVGTANAHKPLLLEGDVDVQKSVASPAEMQFIEGRKSLKEEILAVFDLPATKLGGSTESANRSQSAENDKSFRAESITPLQGIVEEVINEGFIAIVMNMPDTVFNHNEVDLRDEKEVVDIAIEELNHGMMTLNQYLDTVGRKHVDGGDIAFFSTSKGIMPVSDLIQAAEQGLKPPQVPVPGQQPFGQPADPNVQPNSAPSPGAKQAKVTTAPKASAKGAKPNPSTTGQ